jgi:hypothetical protein
VCLLLRTYEMGSIRGRKRAIEMRTHGTMRHYFVLSFRDERREKDRRLYNIQTLLCCHAEHGDWIRCLPLRQTFLFPLPFLNIFLFLNNIFFFFYYFRGGIYYIHVLLTLPFLNLRLVKLRLFFRSNIINIKELSTFPTAAVFHDSFS